MVASSPRRVVLLVAGGVVVVVFQVLEVALPLRAARRCSARAAAAPGTPYRQHGGGLPWLSSPRERLARAEANRAFGNGRRGGRFRLARTLRGCAAPTLKGAALPASKFRGYDGASCGQSPAAARPSEMAVNATTSTNFSCLDVQGTQRSTSSTKTCCSCRVGHPRRKLLHLRIIRSAMLNPGKRPYLQFDADMRSGKNRRALAPDLHPSPSQSNASSPTRTPLAEAPSSSPRASRM